MGQELCAAFLRAVVRAALGALLGWLARGERWQLDEIPLALQQATIATEDGSFYSNPGVDLAGIARALWINATGGEVLAGGSTITQQVARNLLLSPEERGQRSLRRKLRELLLAWRLTQQFSKDGILGLYLNQTYYGGLAYGVEAASQTYFGKPVTELDLAESALLAGLPQAPAVYNPFSDPEAARSRQRVVLGRRGQRRGHQAGGRRDHGHRSRLQELPPTEVERLVGNLRRVNVRRPLDEHGGLCSG